LAIFPDCPHMLEPTDIESGGTLLTRTTVSINHIASEIQIKSFGVQYRRIGESGIPSCQPWITLPFAEVYSVRLRRNVILVHTFRRDVRKPSVWYPKAIDVDFGSKVSQRECMLKVVQDELSNMVQRPKSLLIFINPVSGSKKAVSLYKKLIEPFFKLGGISCDVVETKEFGKDANCQIAAVISDIRDRNISYDGIIAVGGDGLCAKIINIYADVLQMKRSQKISSIYLGHIPCGSTDALCSSLNGTRSMFTSMMHIALGDHINIDSLEVSFGGDRRKHSVCIVTCLSLIHI